ncbi:MAG: hypothetical protein MJZ17_08065 [Bacteroidales bacterium]|nr:hypothetical protein [Bacteroidales bacterium]
MRTGAFATIIFVTTLAFSSCSIKEDRSECPCILNLDYSLIRGDERFISAPSWDSLLVSIPGSYSTIVKMDSYRDIHTIGIPRKKTDLSCYFGMSERRLKGGNKELVIPFGEDSDRLFSYHETLDLGPASEEVFVTPVLCGESTRIIVEFDNDAFLGENGILVATGSTCGLDLWSGRPLEGEFCCTLKSYGDGTWQFNMPRQASRDIALAAVSATSGNLFFSIDLAAELDSAGYDWDARSLPPLAIVHIDSKEMTVDARIIDWDEAIYLDFTL